jgi:hypothetical protein
LRSGQGGYAPSNSAYGRHGAIPLVVGTGQFRLWSARGNSACDRHGAIPLAIGAIPLAIGAIPLAIGISNITI